MRKQLDAIDEAADRLLKMVDERSYRDESLDEIGHIIKDNVAKLKQE